MKEKKREKFQEYLKRFKNLDTLIIQKRVCIILLIILKGLVMLSHQLI